MGELEPVQAAPIEGLQSAELAQMATAPTLAFRATLLDERAYRFVKHDENPLRRGSLALLFAVGMAALARLIGVALGVLTMPPIGVVQEQALRALTATDLYGQFVAANPAFAEQFALGYASVWELISLLGGYPSYAGLLSALLNLLFLLSSWLVYSTAVHLVARWFGASTGYKRTLGVMALAYTPILLTVIEAIPGANVPYLLVFALMLIAKFLAIKTLYQMGPGQNLAILLLPYLLGLILVFGLLLFAAALGLNQFPIIDELLRTLRFAEALR